MNRTIQSLTETTKHSTSEFNRTISRAQSLIAAGDPLSFQQIEAMTQAPVGEQLPQELGEYADALREAETRGFVYNPDDLEDLTYDADSIKDFIEGVGASRGFQNGGGNFFNNHV